MFTIRTQYGNIFFCPSPVTKKAISDPQTRRCFVGQLQTFYNLFGLQFCQKLSNLFCQRPSSRIPVNNGEISEPSN
uniref:Uncharacterized protein n=1 Tax=Arion vulgaris TaxID=1028688 RepID=A0A0B7B9X3_9EUPU